MEILTNIVTTAIMGITAIFGFGDNLGGGPGTINQLDQWTATSTQSAITQNVYGKNVLLSGLNTSECLQLDASGVITTSGAACGVGGGGGVEGSIGTTTPLVDTYITYSTSVSTIGNEAGFTYNDATNLFSFPNATGTQLTLTDLFIGGDEISDFAGTGLSVTGGTLNAEVQTSDLHSAVTLAGALDYITLVGQQITRNAIDLATDITGILDEANIDSTIARDSELHDAVTVSGTRDYITLSGQNIVRGVVDIGDDTNLAGGTNLTLVGSTLSVDDAFLINDGDDTTTGQLTAANFVSTSATSTFANGLNLTDGCFSINGTCVTGGGSGSGTVNSGTANHVAFYDATGTAVSGTSTFQLQPGLVKVNEAGDPNVDFSVAGGSYVHALYVDSATDRVGIKDNSPNYDLDINSGLGTINAMDYYSLNNLVIDFDSPGNLLNIGAVEGANDELALYAGANEVVRITDNNYVGIGTTTPDQLFVIDREILAGSGGFKVQGNSWASLSTTDAGFEDELSVLGITSVQKPLVDLNDTLDYNLVLRYGSATTGEATGLCLTVTNTVGNCGASIIHERTGGNSMGNLQFYTKRVTTGGEDPELAMIIDDAGQVGIGTSTPTALLHVDDTTSGTTTVTIGSSGEGFGGCIQMRDEDDAGWTYITSLNGTLNVSTTSCE